MTRRGLFAALVVAALVRLPPVVAARLDGDVARYQKVAVHVLDVSANPYQAPRLYPYPPVWVGWEVACGLAERHAGVPFGLSVRVLPVAGDLGIVAALAAMAGPAAAWGYALCPVAILVSAVHGQFDALALLAVLLALRWLPVHPDRSALALSLAVGLKSFPVLLAPALALTLPGWPARARYVLLVTVPIALLLAPFALHDPGALRRELFGYGGVADFGWIGLWRGLLYLASGHLARSEAAHWGPLVPIAKALFLGVWAGLVAGAIRGRLPPTPAHAAQVVLVAFLALYGALSAQYLLWAVPLGLLVSPRWTAGWTVAATVALLGFYGKFLPGLLLPFAAPAADLLWVAGVASTAILAPAWLFALGRRP